MEGEDLDHDDDYVLPALQAADENIELHIEGHVEGRLETQHTRWTEAFPACVAEGHGRARTRFDDWRSQQILTGASQWSPFEDEDEWELTQWLFKNVGQSAIDEYLKLPSVSIFFTLNENSSLTYT